MGEVVASISVSLDGYFTGPNPGRGQGLGEGGEVLHGWLRGKTGSREELAANEFVREAFERCGAMISGRDSYDTAEAAWGPEPPFGVPVFVLTHRLQLDDVRTGTTFSFVEDFETALARAREAAGAKDVALHGGSVIVQARRRRPRRAQPAARPDPARRRPAPVQGSRGGAAAARADPLGAGAGSGSPALPRRQRPSRRVRSGTPVIGAPPVRRSIQAQPVITAPA